MYRYHNNYEGYEFDENNYSVKYPWLTRSTMEYLPEDGWQFIEYKNYLNSKVNEKVSESDYKQGIRYLMVKLLGPGSVEQYNNFEPIDFSTQTRRGFFQFTEDDLLTLDLTQSQIDEGYRYLKIYVPSRQFRKGWTTLLEKENGWEVPHKIRQRRSRKQRKSRKQRDTGDKSILDEVKKYISIES